MTGELYLHPSLAAQVQDFKENEVFKIKEIPYDYKTAFSEGDLLVTDYSSVAFDFAYLKKPVIYTQFDKKAFYQKHMWDPGFFKYKEHGFGPMPTTFDAAVKDITDIIEGDCVMPKKYKNRVEKFFYRFDKNNSARVYKAIVSMKKSDE